MLRAIKRVFATAQEDTRSVPAYERRQLEVAVAVLLHEARRADHVEGDEESAPGEQALADLFGLDEGESAALLKEGRAKAQQLTSFYAPVAIIKREFSLPHRIRLVEHLWRISFADGQLNRTKTTTYAKLRTSSTSRTRTACWRATAPGRNSTTFRACAWRAREAKYI